MYAIIPQQIPQDRRAEINEKILFAIDSGKDLVPKESIYNCYTGIGGLHNLLITASIFMMGISLTISGLLPQSGFFIFVVCCAIMGLSVPFYSGVQTALFQEKIKPEYLGRVFSLTGSIMSLVMPIGLILSGFFADRIDVNHWFLLSGILIICIAIVCPMITEIRKLDAK